MFAFEDFVNKYTQSDFLPFFFLFTSATLLPSTTYPGGHRTHSKTLDVVNSSQYLADSTPQLTQLIQIAGLKPYIGYLKHAHEQQQ